MRSKSTEYPVLTFEDIPKIFTAQNVKNILVFSDSPAFSLTGAEKFFSKLESNYFISYITNFSANPKLGELSIILKDVNKIKFDIIVAIGGGSVIDMAKLVKVFSAQDFSPEEYLNNKMKFKNEAKKMIAIPTTFGTGSEVTHFAVLYKDKNKNSIADQKLLPEFIILDPKLTKTMPQYLAACTAMDAFSQAIESFWSINATQQSRNYSSMAITLLRKYIKQAVLTDNLECKREVQKAAFLAGKAINISKTTAPHAFSYPLTSHFGIPHGHAVALFLPTILKYNYQNSFKSSSNWNLIKRELLDLLQVTDENEAVNYINNLMKSIGLKTKISEFELSALDAKEKVTNGINTDRLRNNPVVIDDVDIQNILLEVGEL